MRKNLSVCVLTLLLPTLLLAGCASVSPPSSPPPVVIQPAQVPRLGQSARQPPTPAWCLPTCSAGASSAFDNWLSLPTSAALPASAASGPMIR